MIIINDFNQLEKYKKIQPVQDGVNYVYYEFKENENLADVQMNIEFAPSNDEIFKSLFNEEQPVPNIDELFQEEQKQDDENISNVDFNLYIVRCKNIKFTKNCGFDVLEAENLSSTAKCMIEKIVLTGDVEANEIECNAINCNNIKANLLLCDTLSVINKICIKTLSTSNISNFTKLEVKNLVLNGTVMKNVVATGGEIDN